MAHPAQEYRGSCSFGIDESNIASRGSIFSKADTERQWTPAGSVAAVQQANHTYPRSSPDLYPCLQSLAKVLVQAVATIQALDNLQDSRSTTVTGSNACFQEYRTTPQSTVNLTDFEVAEYNNVFTVNNGPRHVPHVDDLSQSGHDAAAIQQHGYYNLEHTILDTGSESWGNLKSYGLFDYDHATSTASSEVAVDNAADLHASLGPISRLDINQHTGYTASGYDMNISQTAVSSSGHSGLQNMMAEMTTFEPHFPWNSEEAFDIENQGQGTSTAMDLFSGSSMGNDDHAVPDQTKAPSALALMPGLSNTIMGSTVAAAGLSAQTPALLNRQHRCQHPGCTKSYVHARDLSRHARKHNPNGPRFPCPRGGCRFSGTNGFIRADKLRDHQSRRGH